MPSEFDWRNPDFSVRPLGDNATPQQRVRQYVSRAPKRTVKKAPKTSYGMSKNDRYVWDKGMTFAEKAQILSTMGVFGRHSRENAFTQDLDRYRTDAERIMDELRNSSSHVQKYYGVYDDIQAEKKSYGPYNLREVEVTGRRPGSAPSAPRRQAPRQQRRTRPAVQATPEPVPEVVPRIDLSGPTTEAAFASAALAQNRIPDYSPPVLAAQRGERWNAVTDMNGNRLTNQ